MSVNRQVKYNYIGLYLFVVLNVEVEPKQMLKIVIVIIVFGVISYKITASKNIVNMKALQF